MYRFIIKKPYMNLLLELSTPKTMRECSQISGMTYNHLHHVLRNLQQQGVIFRQQVENSNEKIINLTEKGEKIVKNLAELKKSIDAHYPPVPDKAPGEIIDNQAKTKEEREAAAARERLLNMPEDQLRQLAKENEMEVTVETSKKELVNFLLEKAKKQKGGKNNE